MLHFLADPTLLPSHVAYIDGGTGSMLLQAAIAGMMTVGYVVKTRWASLKAMIAKRNRR